MRHNPIPILLESALPKFPEKISQRANGWVEYSENGKSNKAKGLLSESNISVAQWFNSEGFKFPSHKHKQKEWLIVYKGSMELYINEGLLDELKLVLKEGDGYCILPEQEHRAYFPEDCWYIAITYPQCMSWPEPI